MRIQKLCQLKAVKKGVKVVAKMAARLPKRSWKGALKLSSPECINQLYNMIIYQFISTSNTYINL